MKYKNQEKIQALDELAVKLSEMHRVTKNNWGVQGLDPIYYLGRLTAFQEMLTYVHDELRVIYDAHFNPTEKEK